MALRPSLVVEPEMRYAQIGESWQLAVRLVDADTSYPTNVASGTITVTDSVGGALTPSVEDAAMTVSGEELTYTLASASLPSEPMRAMRALIAAVVGSTTWTYLHLFDAVNFSPRASAGYAEVANGVPGVALLAPEEDLNHAKVIREGWEDVLVWLSSLGVYPDLALDSQQLAKGHVYRARHLIYARAARSPDDAYAYQAARWAAEYEDWKTSTQLLVDANASGGIEGEEQRGRSPSMIEFGRSEY